jgi:endonuclease
MTCTEAIKEVFASEEGVLTTQQVTDKIYAKYPDQPWKKSTITAHLMGLSVNHQSSIHYAWARKQAFLFSLGKGRYRIWDPEQDGNWEVTDGGVRLVDDTIEEIEDDELNMQSTALSFERDLEKSLSVNIKQLEDGLEIYNKDDLVGLQLDTGVVGRLDILANDSEGNLVVIELKAGEAGDLVCGQLLRYMGWVKRELADKGQKVRGMIVANSFKDKLKYAVEILPDVMLKRYEISFTYYDEYLEPDE